MQPNRIRSCGDGLGETSIVGSFCRFPAQTDCLQQLRPDTRIVRFHERISAGSALRATLFCWSGQIRFLLPTRGIRHSASEIKTILDSLFLSEKLLIFDHYPSHPVVFFHFDTAILAICLWPEFDCPDKSFVTGMAAKAAQAVFIRNRTRYFIISNRSITAPDVWLIDCMLRNDAADADSLQCVASVVNRLSIGTPYRRAKGTPLPSCGSVDVGRVLRAAGGVGRA